MSGEVAVGEICMTPVGTITLLAAAMVVPDIRAPTMAATFSTLTSLVAASTAPCEAPVVSPITLTILPPSNPPPALTSSVARVTESSIGGMKLAIGPVTSNRMPTLTSWPLGAAGVAAAVCVSVVAAGCAGSAAGCAGSAAGAAACSSFFSSPQPASVRLTASKAVALKSACLRKLMVSPLFLGECVEGDDGQGVLDVRQRLQPAGDEPAYVRIALQVAFDQQIVGAGRGIELAHFLDRVERPRGHVIGRAGVAFDHYENRPHCGLASIQTG